MSTHAHPSPAKPTVPMDDSRRVREFSASLAFQVVLDGLAARDNITVADMHCPRVRRSPYSDRAISHLDVISCWKGLSYSQAMELTLWEQLFRRCLALQVKEWLQGIAVKHVSDTQAYNRQTAKVADVPAYPSDDIPLLPRLLECLHEKHLRRVDIDVTRLIRDMIEIFYDEYCDGAGRAFFAWSCGSGNLPSLLHNFLRTQDCFLHTPTGVCLVVNLLTPSYTSALPNIVANLAWQLPDVKFRYIPEKLQAGEQYCIPAPLVDTSLQSDCSNFYSKADHTHHTISKSALNLQWSSDEDCFWGYVPSPTTDQNDPWVTETVLSCQVVTPFPDGVRFERTSRYCIKLDVVQPECHNDAADIHHHIRRPDSPMEADWMQLDASTTPSRNRQDTPRRSEGRFFSHMPLDRGAGLREGEENYRVLTRATAAASVLQDILFPVLNSQSHSPTKRKASQPQQLPPFRYVTIKTLKDCDLDEYKRRKLGHGTVLNASSDGRSSPSTEWQPTRLPLKKDTAQTDRYFDSTHDNADAQSTSFTSHHMPEAHGQPPLSLTMPDSPTSPTSHQHQSIASRLKGKAKVYLLNSKHAATRPASSGPSPEHTDSDNSSAPDISPPNTATESSHSKQSTELSQEQIQQNYVEFEQKAKRKAAEKAYYASTIPNFDGIVSPTDEVDRDIERAFLADSEAEDWDSDVDGLSEELENLDMEEL
ncbi:Nn.00g083650.m01.CDS01 [Neocucurbitaria sp. VM-36]